MAGRKPLKKSSRGQETREVNLQQQSDNHISISFRYFQDYDSEPVQSLQNWYEEDRLLEMIRSLKHITSENIVQLQSADRKITLYGQFPNKQVNAFTLPTNLQENENWGTLRNIGGQKARIAGFLRDKVFYIVFLDKNHCFYKSNK